MSIKFDLLFIFYCALNKIKMKIHTDIRYYFWFESIIFTKAKVPSGYSNKICKTCLNCLRGKFLSLFKIVLNAILLLISFLDSIKENHNKIHNICHLSKPLFYWCHYIYITYKQVHTD